MLRGITATIQEGFDRAVRNVLASGGATVRALLVIRKRQGPWGKYLDLQPRREEYPIKSTLWKIETVLLLSRAPPATLLEIRVF